ncbi:MAG: sulfate ABC transporter permease subunit CysW [Verrucomicrobiia bacterium]|jgi:sulfate transport system permease protein
MGGVITTHQAKQRSAKRRLIEGSPVMKWLLIAISVIFLGTFLLLPLVNVFAQALSKGIRAYFQSLTLPESVSSIKMTLIIVGISVPLNVIFGISAAWAITKFKFPGKTLLLTFIDLPFSISPVVVGLMYVLLYGLQGQLGQWLDGKDIQIIFNVPGMVLVTIFVTLPFVARELIPIMQSVGVEQEHAALTLGASGWQTFWHVTLPSVKWGLLYGVILCNARAMGEFGAVSVVSGHITGRTDTMPLMVEKFYNDFNSVAAFSLSSLLALLALITLIVKTWLEWREFRDKTETKKPIG